MNLISGNRYTRINFNKDYNNYFTTLSKQNEDGSYSNMYIRVSFRKGEEPKIEDYINIKIKDAFLTFYEYEEKKFLKIMILDYDPEEKQKTVEKIEDIDLDKELPF